MTDLFLTWNKKESDRNEKFERSCQDWSNTCKETNIAERLRSFEFGESIDITTDAGRLDFFGGVMGYGINFINAMGLTSNIGETDLNRAKMIYRLRKPVGLHIDGNQVSPWKHFNAGTATACFIITAKKDVFEKVMKKYSIPASVIQIDYEDGRKGGVWHNDIGAGSFTIFQAAGNREIDNALISHDMRLTTADKITIRKGNLDNEARMQSLPASFMELLK